MTEPVYQAAEAATAPGPLRPFTQEWADALCAALEASEAFRIDGSRWAGAVGLVLAKDVAMGYPRDTAVVLQLEHGHCLGAKLVDAGRARAPFLFRASRTAWERLARGELDPMIALVKGELTLTGSMSSVMQHARAFKAIIVCAGGIPAAFAKPA